MDETIETFARHLTRGVPDQLHKFSLLFTWVATNIEYDVITFLQGGHLPRDSNTETGRGALRTRKATCVGYSDLLQQMCRSCGIECVKIPGYAKGAGYIPGQYFTPHVANHQWNAVYLQGRWYLADVCWSAGYMQQATQTFVFKLTDHYFLSDPEVFIIDHLPLDPSWQLLPEGSQSMLSDFQTGVHLKHGYFQHGVSEVTPQTGVLQVNEGHAEVTLSFPFALTLTYELRHLPTGDEYSKCVSFKVTSSRAEFSIRPVLQGVHTFKVYAKVKGCQEEPEALTTHTLNVNTVSAMLPPWRDLRFPWGPTRHLEDLGLEEVGASCSCLPPTAGKVGASITGKMGEIREFCVSYNRSDPAVRIRPVLCELTGEGKPRRCADSFCWVGDSTRDTYTDNAGASDQNCGPMDKVVTTVSPPSQGHYWLSIYATRSPEEAMSQEKCVANYLICTLQQDGEELGNYSDSLVSEFDTRWRHSCSYVTKDKSQLTSGDEVSEDLLRERLQLEKIDTDGSESSSVLGYLGNELIPIGNLANMLYLMCAKIGQSSQRGCTRLIRYMIE